MTVPRFNFKPEITLGAIFSALLWLTSAAWYVSASASDMRELQRTDARHDNALARLDREGSELARTNAARLTLLEKRMEANDAQVVKIAELLVRIDENVKQLKELRVR